MSDTSKLPGSNKGKIDEAFEAVRELLPERGVIITTVYDAKERSLTLEHIASFTNSNMIEILKGVVDSLDTPGSAPSARLQ